MRRDYVYICYGFWVFGGKCKLHKVARCALFMSSLITMIWDPKAIFCQDSLLPGLTTTNIYVH